MSYQLIIFYSLGHPGLEHEKDRPSPHAKGRKASLKGDETGSIGEITPEIPSHPQLSSAVKEQNDKTLLKVLFFRTN
ncbi:MAG: hypothetical protein COZ68_10235 [Deltaproteobacteria bacterium CG_4_8_14_3_um_filter_43_13]|nr:MAG: hypothetical protein COS67_13295 [Deltaproteobacteria bacterium CG06_land_8_20_14_3_00_44_19]PIX23131.1 MAG: hypothetical protein COZ68_10235 [Deltaproteobacteria bacterium CG_4_8_14_3_um_filter_43_13]